MSKQVLLSLLAQGNNGTEILSILDAIVAESMKSTKNPRRKPYWNFWKVVFAGWLIRYPGKMLRIFGVPIGILIVTIYNAVTK